MSKNNNKIRFVYLDRLVKEIINSNQNIKAFKPTKYQNKKYKDQINYNILSSARDIPVESISHVVFRIPTYISNKIVWNSNYNYTKIPDFKLRDKFKSFSNISLDFPEFIKLVKMYSREGKMKIDNISDIDFIYPHNLLEFLTSEKTLSLKNSNNETIAYVLSY